MKDLPRFLSYFRRRPGTFALGFLSMAGSTALFLAMPRLVRRALETLSVEGVSHERLYGTAALLVALAAGDAVCLFYTRRILIGASRDIEYEMRQDLFAHLLELPASWYRENRVGDLMSRAVNDLSAVRMLVGPGVMQGVNTLFVGVVSIVLMTLVSPMLTLVALSMLPAVALATKIVGQITHKRFTVIQELFSEISAEAQESFSAVRLVRAFAREDREAERFAKNNREFLARNLHLARLNALFFPLLQALVGLGLALTLYFAGRFILAGTLTIPQYVEFNLYLLELIWPAIALGWVVNLWQRGTASWNRMLELWNVPKIQDPAAHLNTVNADALAAKGAPGLTVRGLSFRYPDGRLALDGVSFDVRPGETVALVGRTGAGKSTLLRLLLRIDDPPEGTVVVAAAGGGDTDVRNVPLPELRKLIAVVPQETFLFSDTLAGNIAFSRPSASREEIEQAARAAGLGPDLERFPRGLETRVGERGITLSGGQKQRVALARALLSEARILILDDAFSSVDTETEARIFAAVREAAKSRTVLLVSHRLSTVKEASRIVVLEGGRVTEQGTHEELLARPGLYASLAERQRLAAEVEQVEQVEPAVEVAV